VHKTIRNRIDFDSNISNSIIPFSLLDNNFQVVENKSPVEIGKTEEKLNVFYLPRFGPIFTLSLAIVRP
jgi:hypothetical protein